MTHTDRSDVRCQMLGVMGIRVYASLLAVEKGNTVKEWKRVERYVDGAHIDVMDGKFVPPTTRFTPAFVCAFKTKKVKDVHLMVEQPEKIIPAYVRAGADIVDIHFEAFTSSLRDVRTSLRDVHHKFPKLQVFLAINPETPARAVYPCLSYVDGILCMTVHPGWSGQKFITSVLSKIRAIRARAPRLPIMVDGGINAKTASLARRAGATILVSGSHIFHSSYPRTVVQSLI